MDKNTHIDYWLESAGHDRSAMKNLFAAGNYDWALFMAHLIVEKALKALWIRNNNEDMPPKTHNFEKLARETRFKFEMPDLVWFVQANDFHLETRYPDYKMEFYKRATREFTQTNLAIAERIFDCIRNELQ
ncbi:MAG: HEPN domain-containing protein [Chitinivibrionales bacterium]|nr:HEPN domain-containing protein [Chitinivibrionales bacterium]